MSRRVTTSPPHRPHRVAALAACAAIVLAACGSGGGSTTASGPTGGCPKQAHLKGRVSDHGTKAVPGASVHLEADDFFFAPTCVRVNSGNAITVTIRNDGETLHNFSVKSLGIDKDVEGGKSIMVQVKLPATGVLPFICKYHVSSGMQGAFLVGA